MRRLLSLSLVFLLIFGLLSGCGEATVSDPVVATVGGEAIYKSELDAKSATSDMMFASLTGYSEEELAAKKLSAREVILEEMITERVLLQKAASLGITETPAMREAAEAGWRKTVEAMTDYVLASYPTLTGKELDETVTSMLASQGLEETATIENSIKTAAKNALLEQVKDSAPTPDEAQLKAAYEELMDEQKLGFSLHPMSYEAALLAGDIIVYAAYPCRVVNSVYMKFDDDVISLMKQLKTVGSSEALAEMRDDQFLLMDEKLAEVLARLEGGEDFAKIQEEWQNSGTATNFITAGSVRFADGVAEAVWSIENEGGWTAAFELTYGYQLYCWTDTLPEGEIPLDEVRERLKEQLVTQLRAEAVEAALAEWRSEAGVEIINEIIM